MRRRDYPSDLTDTEWKIREPLIPKPKEGGRPRTTDMREVLNAIFYLDRTGCECESLAPRFSPVVDGLELLSDVAQGWDVATDAHGPARTGAGEHGTRTDAKLRHHR